MGKPLQHQAILREVGLARIEAAVAAAEARTSCEFVVVLAPASARYEGRALRAGALAAVVTFIAIYWVLRLAFNTRPDALYLLAEAMAMGALVAWGCSRLTPLRRLITGAMARSQGVTQAAGATFHEQKVAWTKEHNAALLFVSVLEGEARVLGDLHLQQKAGEAALNEIQAALNSAGSGDGVALIEQALAKLGEAGAEHFPRAADDVNELPDKPVIRLP
jgi:putative membrane protein